MSTGGYSAWVWSPEHQRHYCYRYVNGQIEYQWSGPARAAAAAQAAAPPPSSATPRTVPPATTASRTSSHTAVSTGKHKAKKQEPPDRNVIEEDDDGDDDEDDDEEDEIVGSGDEVQVKSKSAVPQGYPSRPTPIQQNSWQQSRLTSYHGAAQSTAPTYASTASTNTYAAPASPQYTYGQPYSTTSSPPAIPQTPQIAVAPNPNRRHIKTNVGEIETKEEKLDPRYKRVSARHIPQFFCRGRVFKMLWTEPAGVTPGKTRGSTHFSLVRFDETAYSEIRRFIVISNKGQFSQCIPIQTYRGQGARKHGIIVNDHSMIYTGKENEDPPDLLPGEQITKQPLRVTPTGVETLEPASRVNFGKVYTVEHNVKVLDIGVVATEHHWLLITYYKDALTAV